MRGKAPLKRRPKNSAAALLVVAAGVCASMGVARAAEPAARSVLHRFLNELDRAEIAMPNIARSVKSLSAGA